MPRTRLTFEEEVGVPGAGEDVGVGVDVAREAAPFRVDVQGVPEARPVVPAAREGSLAREREVGVEDEGGRGGGESGRGEDGS